MNPKQAILLAFTFAAVGVTQAFQSPSIRNGVGVKRGALHDALDEPALVGDISEKRLQRRDFMSQTLFASGYAYLFSPRKSFADTGIATQEPGVAYVSTPNEKFSYTFTPPASFTASNKPLKTHLDEINFGGDIRGYTYGITVDPVRIKSIKEFGNPEEVAARVVTAEVNRDGVFEVTLAKDPAEDPSGCYDIEYISDGKRGVKRFVTRIYIKDGFLYVLTAQSKNGEYDKEREEEITASVKSFRPL